MSRFSSDMKGIFCVIGAVMIFTTNDMAIKWLSGGYALHEIVFVRSVVAIAITLAIIVPLEGGYRILRTQRPGLHLLRGLFVVAANMTFFTSLATLPLAEATAIFFVAPLLITLLSIPLLGEQVGIRRIGAVIAGFVGVLIMIRPGSESFQVAALLPLAAAFCYAMLQIMTRKIGLSDKASTMAFYIQFTFVIVCSGFGLVAGDGRYAPDDGSGLAFLLMAWSWPTGNDIWIMIGLGVFGSCAAYLVSQGYRIARAATVAPFEYTAMPLAVFWSALIWGDWPDVQAWTGIALICGAGIYVFYRETVQGRKVALERPLPRSR
ncbi:MAG: DMT family transporter [Rhodospirillales bacterium]